MMAIIERRGGGGGVESTTEPREYVRYQPNLRGRQKTEDDQWLSRESMSSSRRELAIRGPINLNI